jgi:transposase-like protein
MGRRNGSSGYGDLKRLNSKKRWSKADARAVLAAWRKSGLSQAEFCRRIGIGTWRLWQWRRRLNGEDSGNRVPRFVPVKLVDGGESPSPGGGWVEVVLPSGLRVRASEAFDVQSLGELVAVLGQTAC